MLSEINVDIDIQNVPVQQAVHRGQSLIYMIVEAFVIAGIIIVAFGNPFQIGGFGLLGAYAIGGVGGLVNGPISNLIMRKLHVCFEKDGIRQGIAFKNGPALILSEVQEQLR